MNRYDVLNNFKVGDIIRNIDPYFGEGSYKLVYKNKFDFIARKGASIRGIGGYILYMNFGEFIAEDSKNFTYKKCGIFTRMYLWILGNTIGRINNV